MTGEWWGFEQRQAAPGVQCPLVLDTGVSCGQRVTV